MAAAAAVVVAAAAVVVVVAAAVAGAVVVVVVIAAAATAAVAAAVGDVPVGTIACTASHGTAPLKSHCMEMISSPADRLKVQGSVISCPSHA